MSFNLKEVIERIEFLIAEKNKLNTLINDQMNLIKSELNVERKMITTILKKRKQHPQERKMEEERLQALMLTL